MIQIFISYSAKRYSEAEILDTNLKILGYSPWMDRTSIQGGELWKVSIIKAIENSVIVLILVTHEAVSSQNVRDEMKIAKMADKPVLPLILDQFEHFPSVLRSLDIDETQAINFVESGFEKGFANLKEALEYWTYPAWLSSALSHYNSQVRLNALDKVEKDQNAFKNEKILTTLIRFSRLEEDLQVRDKMIYLAGLFAHPLALDFLISLLRNARPSLIYDAHHLAIAAKRLGSIGIGNPYAREVLFNAVTSKSNMLKMSAAMALRNFDEEAHELGFSTLIDMLNSGNQNTRCNVTRELGEFGDKRAITLLLPLLHDPDESVRFHANLSLKKLGYQPDSVSEEQ